MRASALFSFPDLVFALAVCTVFIANLEIDAASIAVAWLIKSLLPGLTKIALSRA